jgi:aspartate kinase
VRLVVRKYGGTSVGTPERIRTAARRVAAAHRNGEQLVIVVSAMGDSTDDLVALAGEVSGSEAGRRHPREWDMLLSAGERIAMALVAMAIRDQRVEALSFTGSQAAIVTDGAHTAARITEIRAERVREELNKGHVVIVAGFQGVSPQREVTTLGRGGSDTTAVALAAALGADACEIYTDVDGIYTADPRRVPDARRIREISHAEMVELATAGAQVMHPRAVEIGARYGVDIRVLSSLADTPEGTLITRTPRGMEELALSGIASSRGQARLVARDLPPGLATSAELLSRLASAAISVDTITEALEATGRSQLQLTVAQEVLGEARRIAEHLADELGGGSVETLEGLARIALVGSGMTGRPGVYAQTFRVLLEAGVSLHAVSTSSISITVWVPEASETVALEALHRAFGLDR